LWLSALAAFNNCQLPDQFTSSEQLKPAAAQWFCLFQEALLRLAGVTSPLSPLESSSNVTFAKASA